MTTFGRHRATVEAFVDCMQGGADKDALARILAENVVLIGPLSDEPLTGREAVTAAIQGVSTVAADLVYKEVLSGETHHAAFFRLQIEIFDSHRHNCRIDLRHVHPRAFASELHRPRL